jgi:hypothetical protein
MFDERLVKPMPNELDEKKVQLLVRDILAKPGFIRNGATVNLLERSFRRAMYHVIDGSMREAVNAKRNQ